MKESPPPSFLQQLWLHQKWPTVVVILVLWRNVPQGLAQPGELVFKCVLKVSKPHYFHYGLGKKSNPALDKIICSGERENASLWSHSRDKTGVCLIISGGYFCPILFCSCHNKIPSGHFQWSKAFPPPFKEKSSIYIHNRPSVALFYESLGQASYWPHKAMWGDTTGRSSHLRQLRQPLTR